jgi:hypothetical protein
MAPSTKTTPERYDTPDANETEEDDEVEIEIRQPTHTNAHGNGGNGAGSGGTMWLPPEESNALEYAAGDQMEPNTPISMRTRLRNLLRLPNSAIKQTWQKLDISEDGICEQEEYGESRDGRFWKFIHEMFFGSNTLHGQVCGVILLIMISASVTLGSYFLSVCLLMVKFGVAF